MNKEQVKELMEKLVNYEDSEVGAKIVQSASFEHFDDYIVNGNIIIDEEQIGKVVFKFVKETNSVELSNSFMNEDSMEQGLGTRFVAYATEVAQEYGASYITTIPTSEISQNLFNSAGWESISSTENMPEEAVGLEL